MNRFSVFIASIVVLLCLCIGSHAAVLSGDDFAFKSRGAKSDAGGWEMKASGYLGTLIRVEKPTRVSFGITACGRNAVMHLHVGDKKFVQQTNNTDPRDFRFACQLPAGTYRVKIELANAFPGREVSLRVISLDVSGDKVTLCNERSDKLVLEAADTYIENYRKGNARLVLTNAKGRPLPAGTPVHIKLRKHAFNFGTAITGAEDNIRFLQDNPTPGTDEYKYQQFVISHFNMIVPDNAGKWKWTELERDKVTLEAVDATFAFAEKYHLNMRMHCLLWKDSVPQWVTDLLDTAQNGKTEQEREAAKADLRKQISERISYLTTDRRPRDPRTSRVSYPDYKEIDGLNEGGHKPEYTNIFGNEGVGVIFDEVLRAYPCVRIYCNEYNVFQWNKINGYEDDYCNWFKDHIEAIRAGMSPSNWKQLGVGLQYYPLVNEGTLQNCPHTPVTVSQILQSFSGFELPISLTEFAVQPGGEDYAPRYLSETMRLVFGADETTGFVVWGFWKPCMAVDASPLVDKDWNITQCGKNYEQLVGIRNWGIKDLPSWMTDLKTKTAPNGELRFRGFCGDYDVTVNGRTYPLTITKGESRYKLRLRAKK